MRASTRVALAAAVGLLAGCGGGGHDSPAFVAEGTSATPKAIGSAIDPGSQIIYAGQVDKTASFYTATVTNGAIYTISLTNLTDDADLWAGFNTTDPPLQSMTVGLADESIEGVTATSATLYVQVLGEFAREGTGFTLTITRLP